MRSCHAMRYAKAHDAGEMLNVLRTTGAVRTVSRITVTVLESRGISAACRRRSIARDDDFGSYTFYRVCRTI